jgi:hypothetical protein
MHIGPVDGWPIFCSYGAGPLDFLENLIVFL